MIGFVVVAGAFTWAGYQAYTAYESRNPSSAETQETAPRTGARASNLRPGQDQAVSIFRKLASGAQQAVGIGSKPAPAFNSSGLATSTFGAVFYSPWQNLEEIDSNAIARSNCNHLDIAAYAFTDQRLAEAVAAFARSGRPVRIYRDHEQYEQEQKRGSRVSNILQVSNISIRVKNSAVLMHQKAWSDGCVFREGSANWSPSGERQQDNTLTFMNDPASVNNFERAFDAMWVRSDNIVVQ